MIDKKLIIQELAKLERLNWSKDKKIASSIFPYVLVEAINLLLNSTVNEECVDYMSTSKEVRETLDSILEVK